MYQSEPTRHAVHINETVKHVPCVMDVLIVALLHDDDTIEIHSESPENGETIRFRITENDVTVVPVNAVISFGLGTEESTDPDFDSLKDSLNAPDTSILTTCSVINAFSDSASFERWAADISEALVVEITVEKAFSLSKQAARTALLKPSVPDITVERVAVGQERQTAVRGTNEQENGRQYKQPRTPLFK